MIRHHEGALTMVAPAYDPSGVTALAGATMMFELLCLLAAARGR